MNIKKSMFRALSLFMFFSATYSFAVSNAWAGESSSYGSANGSSYSLSSGSSGSYGGTISDEDCRACHADLNRFPQLKYRNPDKHHVLIGQKIPVTTIAPNGTPDSDYACLSCHSMYQIDDTYQVSVVRDCLECHPLRSVTGSHRSDNVHHMTPTYQQFSCSVCHSDKGY